MKKSEVKIRWECHRPLPCLNVKVHHFAPGLDVEGEFGCDLDTADKAREYVFNSRQQQFWEDAPVLAEECLGEGCKVESAGRNLGWLVVYGLPPVGGWDAIQLARWARFAKRIQESLAWNCSAEQVREDIKANRWAETGAEEYNFIDTKEGKTLCIADLKTQAKAAGFGPVLRA